MTTMLGVPVAFFIFNRPDVTRRVFEAIRAIRPKTLLVVADGPRSNVEGETERCESTRQIVDEVDWDCCVLRNFSDVNLGCKWRVSSGLDWVFEQVDRAIVLEDDCVPEQTFFRFCEQMLNRYENDPRVVHIGGTNFQPRSRRSANDYYFSRYTHVWGWASWRRAWKNYDVRIADWPERRHSGWLESVLSNDKERKYWTHIFDCVHSGRIDTWDYQLTYSAWRCNGLAVIPGENLVSNIGFGWGATHTSARNRFSEMATRPIVLPLACREELAINRSADAYTEKIMFSGTERWSSIRRIGGKIARRIGLLPS